MEKTLIYESFLSDPRFRSYVLRGGIIITHKSEADVLQFRRIVEMAMKQGRWFGFVAKES